MKLNFQLLAATILATAHARLVVAQKDDRGGDGNGHGGDGGGYGGDVDATCNVNPDPHFKTWDNVYYDYHGGCDVVLIQNPTFSPNGLDLHIRTRPMGGWAGITNAALRIDSDMFEIQDNGDYYVNNALNPALPIAFGGYMLSATAGGFEVLLNGNQYIAFSQWAGMPGGISLHVGADAADFSGSVGLCGTWNTPAMIARNGVTDFNPNGHAFGENWQVLSTEPMLFQIAEPPQHPDSCLPPSRRLTSVDTSKKALTRGSPRKLQAAQDVCAHLVGPEFNNCVFDVTTTGDESWAKAPWYQEPWVSQQKCMSEDNYCQLKGGQCVTVDDCDEATHYCVAKMCQPAGNRETLQYYKCMCAVPH